MLQPRLHLEAAINCLELIKPVLDFDENILSGLIADRYTDRKEEVQSFITQEVGNHFVYLSLVYT